MADEDDRIRLAARRDAVAVRSALNQATQLRILYPLAIVSVVAALVEEGRVLGNRDNWPPPTGAYSPPADVDVDSVENSVSVCVRDVLGALAEDVEILVDVFGESGRGRRSSFISQGMSPKRVHQGTPREPSSESLSSALKRSQLGFVGPASAASKSRTLSRQRRTLRMAC